MIRNMKKLIFTALAAFCLVACGKPSTEADKPSFIWENNASFSITEISTSMKDVITVSVPSGVSSFTIKLTSLPVELIGVANELIGIAGNKASSQQAGVIDLVSDDKAAKTLSDSRIVVPAGASLKGAKSCTVNVARLVMELVESSISILPNRSRIALEMSVTDAAGNTLSKAAQFNWTSAPKITSTVANGGTFVIKDGEVGDFTVDIDCQGKIAELTIAFGGDAATVDPKILDFVKARTTSKTNALLDLINDSKVASGCKLPASAELKDKTSASLNLKEMLLQASYTITPGKKTTMEVGVVDALGKSARFSVTLSSEQ